MADPDLILSPLAYNAWLIRGVIESTPQPGETAEEARTRSGAIIEMFKGLAPEDALQGMVACHCISLRFVLQAAMRDAGNVNLDPKTLIRARASAMSISRGLHMWLNKLQSMKAHNDAGAVETGRSGDHGQAKQLPPAVSPAMRQSPPPASPPAASSSGITAPGVIPRDIAALGAPHQGSRSPGAGVFTAGAPEPSGPVQPIRQPAWPGRAALPMAKEALLASAAVINDQRHDRGALAVPKTG